MPGERVPQPMKPGRWIPERAEDLKRGTGTVIFLIAAPIIAALFFALALLNR